MSTATQTNTDDGLEQSPTTSGDLHVAIKKTVNSAFELKLEFTLHPGISILFGPSGAGKTTLLDCIAGLSKPDAGQLTISNRVLFDSAKHVEVPITRRNIGYVFQDLALFPHLKVEANVGYGLSSLSAAERKTRVEQALEALGIASLARRSPSELSGGERQRVALARALVTRPSVLLLDEPLAALDLPIRMKIADDLRRSIQSSPIAVLYVTHSRDEVFMLGEHLLVIERGKIIAEGTPHQVLSAPRLETVAQLAGFENIFDATVTSIHEDRGTMTCRLASLASVPVELETPLVRSQPGDSLRVGISAGDILLATEKPAGLSARNVLRGTLLSLNQRDAIIVARVDCGVEIAAHLTLGARDSLGLAPGRELWVIVKTHSCHLLAK